ncbi:MAG TPA: glycosyltransferase family 39 protein [Flavisolibacter sp.]|nr:glycosyltransferase family 39 protein [Flavisolibacter sp.]
MKTAVFSVYRKLVILALFVYAIVQIYCINQLSVNYDEGSFASYGLTLLKFQRNKDVLLYESKLPITALNMLPRAVEQFVHPQLKKTWPQSQSDIINGRYVSLLFAILLGFLVFKWAEKLNGERVALFVLLTYLLCPNFLAHGIFVSSDIFACFFMTLALYYLWRFLDEKKIAHFVLMTMATAMAEISKFSMVHLFLIIPLLVVVHFLFNRDRERGPHFNLKKAIIYILVFLLINWLIICTSHLFYQVFLPIKDYRFMSESFKHLQVFLSKISLSFPVPLPSSYIKSMDAVVYFDQLGGGVNGSLNGAPYILGKSNIHGFWYYYFVSIFFKTPITTLLLWTTALLMLFLKFSKKVFFKNEIFLILPAFYFLVYMNFFYGTQVGIRHILIIFPLLMIFSGGVISKLILTKKMVVLYAFLAFEAISVFSYFPHFLPYTNEFIVDKKLVYKKIASTNICYGEGKKFLQDYLIKNPDAAYMPETPISGKAVFEVNELLSLHIRTQHKYDWAKSLMPIDHIHSQYLIFDIDKQAADSLKKLYY